MKKLMAVLLMAAILVGLLTGCTNLFAGDDSHATMTITTSDGDSIIRESYNGLNRTWSGQKSAIRHVCTVELEQGQSMRYLFKCEACGDIQEAEIDYPYSGVISCKCPEEGDENGNAKEFFAIKVFFVN